MTNQKKTTTEKIDNVTTNEDEEFTEILTKLMIFEDEKEKNNAKNTAYENTISVENNEETTRTNENNLDNYKPNITNTETEDINPTEINVQNMQNSSSDENMLNIERLVYEMIDNLNHRIDMQMFNTDSHNTNAYSNNRSRLRNTVDSTSVSNRITNEEIERINTELHQDLYNYTNNVNNSDLTINYKLSVRKLKRIIVYRYKNKIKKQQDSNCCVCFCPFNPDNLIMELVCEHFFHKTCIKPWLKTQGICPMCRCLAIKNYNN